MYAIGLMSGTSLDGVDAALIEIDGSHTTTHVKLIAFTTQPMPEEIKERINMACDPQTVTTDLICSLNFELGYLFSEAVTAVLKKGNLSKEALSFIASHGQTIYHLPHPHAGQFASTLQIGEPAVIAFEQQTTVVSNFRVMDMAAHGEGAPLVPYSEWLLYREENQHVALQNIGGIGNVTVLKAGADINDVEAFDTGPGNMMIDEACQQLFSVPYDDGGGIALQGVVQEALLQELMTHPFIEKKPPKSTGREEFGQAFVTALLKKYQHLDPKDIIATFTMYTAKTIAVNYERFIIGPLGRLDKAILGGGGAHNQALIHFLKELLPEVEILLQEDLGFSSDAKEAIAFAIMGNETLHHQPSNVMSATGASCPVMLGNVTYSPMKGDSL